MSSIRLFASPSANCSVEELLVCFLDQFGDGEDRKYYLASVGIDFKTYWLKYHEKTGRTWYKGKMRTWLKSVQGLEIVEEDGREVLQFGEDFNEYWLKDQARACVPLSLPSQAPPSPPQSPPPPQRGLSSERASSDEEVRIAAVGIAACSDDDRLLDGDCIEPATVCCSSHTRPGDCCKPEGGPGSQREDVSNAIFMNPAPNERKVAVGEVEYEKDEEIEEPQDLREGGWGNYGASSADAGLSGKDCTGSFMARWLDGVAPVTQTTRKMVETSQVMSQSASSPSHATQDTENTARLASGIAMPASMSASSSSANSSVQELLFSFLNKYGHGENKQYWISCLGQDFKKYLLEHRGQTSRKWYTGKMESWCENVPGLEIVLCNGKKALQIAPTFQPTLQMPLPPPSGDPSRGWDSNSKPRFANCSKENHFAAVGSVDCSNDAVSLGRAYADAATKHSLAAAWLDEREFEPLPPSSPAMKIRLETSVEDHNAQDLPGRWRRYEVLGNWSSWLAASDGGGMHVPHASGIFILDGLNILKWRNKITWNHSNGREVDLDWNQLDKACQYYVSEGQRVKVFLKPLRSGDAELVRLRNMYGDIFRSCCSASDDRFMINAVRQQEKLSSSAVCRIVTNDRFEDWKEKDLIDASWIQKHCVRFTFDDGRFLPDILVEDLANN